MGESITAASRPRALVPARSSAKRTLAGEIIPPRTARGPKAAPTRNSAASQGELLLDLPGAMIPAQTAPRIAPPISARVVAKVEIPVQQLPAGPAAASAYLMRADGNSEPYAALGDRLLIAPEASAKGDYVIVFHRTFGVLIRRLLSPERLPPGMAPDLVVERLTDGRRQLFPAAELRAVHRVVRVISAAEYAQLGRSSMQ